MRWARHRILYICFPLVYKRDGISKSNEFIYIYKQRGCESCIHTYIWEIGDGITCKTLCLYFEMIIYTTIPFIYGRRRAWVYLSSFKSSSRAHGKIKTTGSWSMLSNYMQNIFVIHTYTYMCVNLIKFSARRCSRYFAYHFWRSVKVGRESHFV